jgi:hypothetical protein
VFVLRFEEALGRYRKRRLTAEEAGEILGLSGRHFRRLLGRYAEEGVEGLRDRRLGQPSPRRAPVAELTRMQILYQERYRDFTVKHFHEQLVVKRHDDTLGYTVTPLALQGAGLVVKQKRRGPHRKKRERRPLPGMLLFQSLPRRKPGTARPLAGSRAAICCSITSSCAMIANSASERAGHRPVCRRGVFFSGRNGQQTPRAKMVASTPHYQTASASRRRSSVFSTLP